MNLGKKRLLRRFLEEVCDAADPAAAFEKARVHKNLFGKMLKGREGKGTAVSFLALLRLLPAARPRRAHDGANDCAKND